MNTPLRLKFLRNHSEFRPISNGMVELVRVADVHLFQVLYTVAMYLLFISVQNKVIYNMGNWLYARLANLEGSHGTAIQEDRNQATIAAGGRPVELA